MRWSSLVVVALAAGCVHGAPPPASVTAVTAESPAACDLMSSSRSILLTIRNAGPGKLRLKAQDQSGPPYRMGWPYYTVLSGQSDPPAVYKSPTGHANLPVAIVAIGPNDQTDFLLYLGEFTPVSTDLRYRAQFEDLDGQVHFSAPFQIACPGLNA